jgi:hypothetical protein
MSATGKYAALPTQTQTVYYTAAAAAQSLGSGMAASNGFFAEWGRITYLAVPLPPSVRAGIDASLSVGYMNIKWDDVYGVEIDDQFGEFITDARIGPAITVSAIPGLDFDAGVKFGYGIAGGSSVSISTFPVQGGRNVTIEDTHDEIASGVSRSFTFSARYGGFVIGWEMHSMSVERNRSYSAQRNDGFGGDFNYTSSIAPTTTRIFIGVSR